MKKYLLTLILASLTLCFSATLASAQNTSGVTGVVKDGTGAVVAGADVKLTDTKTGTEQTTKTNDQKMRLAIPYRSVTTRLRW